MRVTLRFRNFATASCTLPERELPGAFSGESPVELSAGQGPAHRVAIQRGFELSCVAVAIAPFALLRPRDAVPGDSRVRDNVASARFVFNFEGVSVFCDCDRLRSVCSASMSATLTLGFTLVSRLATAATLVAVNRQIPGAHKICFLRRSVCDCHRHKQQYCENV